MTQALSCRIESEAFAAHQLRVSSFRGSERIGRLFELEIDVVLTAVEGLFPALQVQDVVGAEASFVLDDGVGSPRVFAGLVSSVRAVLDGNAHHPSYRLTLVPLAHRLALVAMQDIHQDESVPQILASKLELVGVSGELVRFALHGDHPVREFTVQYGETDLAFVSRLAEHAGVSFFFEEHEGGTRLVFADEETSFPWLEGESVPFRAPVDGPGIHSLTSETRLSPATHIVYDYNYRTPQVDLRGQVLGAEPSFGGIAEYGCHIKSPEEGASLAAIRAEETRSGQTTFEGASSLPQLAAGARTRIAGHPTLGDEPLLLIEVLHEGASARDAEGQSTPTYSNRFRAVPGGFTYRPPRTTPRPRIDGVVNAVIEGVDGVDSLHAKLDDQGRYTVRFHFDVGQEARLGSRPLRMAQPHAGAGYGMHFPLEVGTEVLVAFVHGDPDRPVIVGAVSNPLTPSPVASSNPDHNVLRTRSGVRLRFNDGTPRRQS